MRLKFMRMACSGTMLLMISTASQAQTTPDGDTASLPLKTVSTTQPASVTAPASTLPDLPESPPESPPAAEPFLLPVEQHSWARFQPGAWRELQTVSERFDEAGQFVSRSVTTQKEILQAVAEGKYVLQVQATVDLGGKRIVGDWKTHVLHLATDGAGPISDSRRVENRSLSLAGRAVECQVFELRYLEGDRNLTELVYYDSQRFPFVLQRETFADNGQQETTTETEQLIEVTAQAVPYRVGEQLLDCCCLRTLRHRTKGDTLRLAFSTLTVPGGEVAVWSTDFGAQGQRVRWSVTTLLAYGETSPQVSKKD